MIGNAAEVSEPARGGPVELRNRVIKAATFEGMTPRGLVTDELIEFHRRFAQGGVAMTTVAYCAVSPEGRTDRHQIWMRPEAVPGLGKLAEAVHAEGAAISAQIGHAGPVANPVSNRLAALGPFRRPSPLGMRMIKAASAADLHRVMARALLREPDLLHRIRSDSQARSLCIHCNKCMPTIYSGTRCVLATPDGGVTARRRA